MGYLDINKENNYHKDEYFGYPNRFRYSALLIDLQRLLHLPIQARGQWGFLLAWNKKLF